MITLTCRDFLAFDLEENLLVEDPFPMSGKTHQHHFPPINITANNKT